MSSSSRRFRRIAPHTRRAVAAWSALSLAVVTTGAVTATSAQALPAAKSKIPSGITINVGDQQQQAETLMNSSGVLKGAPYKVNYVEFDNGPLVDSGLAADKIDIGSMGDTPAEVAVSEKLPVKAILTTLAIGASEYLVARPGITSIAQLKGKKVAYTTGTAEQAFALRALAEAGLTQKEVQQVDVSLTQLGTVIESGNADASVLSIEFKADYLQQDPKAKVLAADDTTKPPSYGYTLANTKALNNPGKLAAIEDYAKRVLRANVWEKTHKSQWIQDYYVNVEHQTPSEAKTILAAGGLTNYVPIGAKQEKALRGVVQLLVRSGAIPKSFNVTPLYSKKISGIFNKIVANGPKGVLG